MASADHYDLAIVVNSQRDVSDDTCGNADDRLSVQTADYALDLRGKEIFTAIHCRSGYHGGSGKVPPSFVHNRPKSVTSAQGGQASRAMVKPRLATLYMELYTEQKLCIRAKCRSISSLKSRFRRTPALSLS